MVNMWKNRAFIFFVVVLLPSIECRRLVPFFRMGYFYLEEFNAFYKTHYNSDGQVNWTSAFLTCQDEESILFHPKTPEESKVIISLVKNTYPDISNVLLGLRDEFNVGQMITADGHTTPYPLLRDDIKTSFNDCVFMDTEEYNVAPCTINDNRPIAFVCKKVIDPSCPTIDRGYKFVEEYKKCYKIHNREKVWHEAAATCFQEGGILAVPDNEGERQTIRNILQEKKQDPDQTYFIGVYKRISTQMILSIKGHEFRTYHKMFISDDQDHSLPDGDREYCVSIKSQTDYLFKSTCNYPNPFVCELGVSYE